MRPYLLKLFFSLALVPFGAQGVVAQAQDSTLAPPQAADQGPDSLSEARVSPKGAFLRAIALPAWGHASIGSHRRGTFYTAAEGGTAWMLFRVSARLSSARSLLAQREAVRIAELESAGITDPDEVESELASDPDVDDARDLVSAREQQREDWIALGIFLILISGADAYVSAHLQDFPVAPVVNVGDNGRVDLGLRLRVGRD